MKKILKRLIGAGLCILMVPCGPVYSLPVIDSAGADVSVVEDVSTMTITVGDKAIINYSDFSIGGAETVQFVQPSSTAVALNRVTGSSRSVIDGSLLANGRIFLVNPNGVLIGSSGVVNAAGFVASSLAISDSDFLLGNYNFTGGSTADGVRNDGHINVAQGGIVGLIGRQVVNNGQIDAGYGAVILAAGDTVSVDFDGDGLMSFSVNGALADSLVRNAGSVHAGGGEIVLAASAAADIAGGVVNNTGVVEAMSVDGAVGSIRLVAPGAGIRNEGEITTAGRNGAAGGTISFASDSVSNEGTINVAGDAGAAGGTVNITAGSVDGSGAVIADEVVEGDAPESSEEAAGEETVAAEATGSVINVGTIDATAGQASVDAAGDFINEGLINIENGVLDIDAVGEIYNTGSINAAGGVVNLDAEGAVSTSGSIVAETVNEQGAAFAVSGIFLVGTAYMDNADGAANFGTGTYSGTMSDGADVIIDDSAVITLGGDLVITADDNTDGTGLFSMGAGSSIVGAGYNLGIYASQDSILRDISGVGTLTVGESQAASAPTISMWGNVTVDDLVVVATSGGGDTTFAIGASLLTVNSSITNNDHITMWGGTIDLNGNFTRVGNLYAQRGAGDDPAEIFIEGNWADTWWFGCDNSIVYFEGGGTSTVDVGADAAANAFNSLVVQNSTTLRPVTNDMQAANITLNDASSSTFDGATNDLPLTVTGTFYVGSGCQYLTGTGVNTIATLTNNGGTVNCEGLGANASNMAVTTMTNYDNSTWYYSNNTGNSTIISGTYYDLNIDDGGTSRFFLQNGDVTVNHNMVLSDGEYQIGNNTLNVGGNLANFDILSVGTSGTLDIGGNFTVGNFTCLGDSTVNIGGNWNGAAAGFVCGTSTVTFDGGGTSTVNTGGDNFRNVTVSNGTTLQAVTNNVVVPGTLTLTGAGSIVDMATNDLQLTAVTYNIGADTTYKTGTATQIAGLLTNNGTIECEGAGFDGTNLQFTGFTSNAGSTMYFTAQAGTAYVSFNFDYANLWFNDNGGGATYEFNAGTVDVAGDFKNMGGTVEVGDNTLNVAGNFINNDTVVFNAGVLDVEGNMDDFGILTSNVNTQIFVGGNVADIYWLNEGTSTITFDGGGTSTLSGGTAAGHDFYNIVIASGTTVQLLDDAATANFTNNGTLNQNGFTLYVAGSAYVAPTTGGGDSGGSSGSSSSTTSTTTTTPTPTPVFPPSWTPAGGTDWSTFAGTSGGSGGGTPGAPNGGPGAPIGTGNGSGDGMLFGNPGNGPVNGRNLLSPQSHFVVVDDMVSPIGESPFGGFEDGDDEDDDE